MLSGALGGELINLPADQVLKCTKNVNGWKIGCRLFCVRRRFRSVRPCEKVRNAATGKLSDFDFSIFHFMSAAEHTMLSILKGIPNNTPTLLSRAWQSKRKSAFVLCYYAVRVVFTRHHPLVFVLLFPSSQKNHHLRTQDFAISPKRICPPMCAYPRWFRYRSPPLISR